MGALEDISGIQQARDAGYSDDEIYSHLAGRPEFAKAKSAGYSFDEVYQHMYSKAQQQALGMQDSALGTGTPLGGAMAMLRGDLKVEPTAQVDTSTPSQQIDKMLGDMIEADAQSTAAATEEAIRTPMVKIPQPSGTSTATGVGASLAKNISELTTPENISILAGSSLIPGVGRVVAAGFGAKMLKDLPGNIIDTYQAFTNPNATPRQKAEAATDTGVAALMAVLGLKHGLGGRGVPGKLRESGLSEDQINRALTQAKINEMDPKQVSSGEKRVVSDEVVDGLNSAKQRILKDFSNQLPEIQKQRQGILDTIEEQLLEVPRDQVIESRARVAEQAQQTPPGSPAAEGIAEVPASPQPTYAPRIRQLAGDLENAGAPVTAQALESSPPPEVEPPAPGQPGQPIAAEERPQETQTAPATEGAAVKPSPLVGPAMLSGGEAVAKGVIGQKHADLIKQAVSTGNVDAITGEHGFHDAQGNVLTRTEAAQRALDTGQIDQSTFDKAMARPEGPERGLHSEDLMPKEETPTPVNPEAEKTVEGLRKLGRVNRDPAESVARELKFYSNEERSQLQQHLGTTDANPDTLAQAITGKSRMKETSRTPSYVDEPSGKEGRGHPTADVAKEAFGEDYTGGPGAMGPREAEAMQQAQMSTGLNKATVLTERLSRGEKPLPAAERQSETEAVSRAMGKQDSDPMAARNLVARILDQGDTAISRDDAALLLVERNRVTEDMRQADARLKNDTSTPLERSEAQEQLKDLETQIDRLDKAQKEAGSQWGRVGRMYQWMIREDYSLEGIQRKMRTAKGGPLTEEERAQSEKSATKMEEAMKAKDTAEATKTAEQEKEDLRYYYDQTIKDLQKEISKAPKVSKPVLDIAQKIVDRWKTDAENARKSLRERLGRTSAGVDPTIVLDVARIMRAHVGEIGLDLAKVSARVLEDFGEAVKPYLKDAWAKTKELIDKEDTTTAAKTAVKKGVGVKDKTPTQVAAKAKAEAMAGEELSNSTVYELARAHIKAGVHGEDAVMKAVHNDVKEAYPNASERDVRRAFSDYGKTKFPSQEAVSKELREIRTLTRLQESIDRLKGGQDALKTGPQRDKATQEIREKQKQLNELLKTRQGPPSPEKLASQEEAKIRSLQNRIEDIDKELRTGERPPEGAKVPDSPAVEQLKAERDAMQEKLNEVREAQKPKPTEAEKAADKAQQAVDRAAAALDRQQRINRGEIKPEPKEKTQPLSELEKELRDRTEELQKAKRDAEKPTPEESYNKRRMTQITKREAELKEMLRTGNFEKSKPAPLKKDAAVAAAEARLTEVRREVDKAIERKKYEQLSPQQKFFKEAMSVFRSITAIKVLGHGSVGMVTHAGGLIFRPTRAAIYWRNFGRQFGMWAKPAYHEQLIYRLKTDPEFETWKKAGASIDPEKTYTDYGMYAQWLGKLGEAGGRGFDALKLVRMEMNKADWNRVPDEIKADPKQADAARKLIAEINNKATGATPKMSPLGKTLEEGFYGVAKNPVLEAAFFAPRLYASRWGRVLFDPVKTARTLFDPQSSAAERFAANTKLKNAVEFTGTLVAAMLTNQAILSATGSNQKVNLTDPTKSDWLKFKGGGKNIVADGGLLDPVRLIGQVIWKDLLAERTKQQQYREGTRFKMAVDTVGSYLRGKLAPPVGLATDVATGSDFQGRPLPFSKERPQQKDQTPYEWGEWLLSQGPIPMAGTAKEVAADLKDKGFDGRQTEVIIKAIASFGLGMAGVHVGEDYSTQPKSIGMPKVKLKRR